MSCQACALTEAADGERSECFERKASGSYSSQSRRAQCIPHAPSHPSAHNGQWLACLLVDDPGHPPRFCP